jgi:pSer/pThr/pTyr-binding forkhead associated (FHA) protein
MDLVLVIFNEDGQRREFSLLKERTSIGRSDESDLQIPLPTVSRNHCEVVIQDNAPVLKDIDSSNGTYHNNQRITGSQTLVAGDHIRVGPVTFTVVIDGEPHQIKPIRTILGDMGMEPVQDHSITETGETVDVAPDGDIPIAHPIEDEISLDDEGDDTDPLKALENLDSQQSRR